MSFRRPSGLRARRLPVMLLGALVGAACASLVGVGSLRPGSGGDASKFTHARHLKAKMECIACHDAVYDATDLSKHFLPLQAKCRECHKDQFEKKNCAMCHTNVEAAAPPPPRDSRITIDHSKHIDRVNEDCTVCHKGLPEPGVKATAPKMTTCTSCHNHQEDYDYGRCGGCHIERWTYPITKPDGFKHPDDMIQKHRESARSPNAGCSTCHQLSFCTDCHTKMGTPAEDQRMFERRYKRIAHKGDFPDHHGEEAFAGSATCQRCHDKGSCDSCHASKERSVASVNPQSPHPAGWAYRGSPKFHGDVGKEDFLPCLTCHDQPEKGADCTDCHHAGGKASSVHGPGFASTHHRIDPEPICAECHRDGAANAGPADGGVSTKEP